MDKVIGTCSECGGAVTVPENWMGVNPPVPTCKSCGATLAQPNGAVIPMQPNRRRTARRFGLDNKSPPVYRHEGRIDIDVQLKA